MQQSIRKVVKSIFSDANKIFLIDYLEKRETLYGIIGTFEDRIRGKVIQFEKEKKLCFIKAIRNKSMKTVAKLHQLSFEILGNL